MDAIGNGPTFSAVFHVRTMAAPDTQAPLFAEGPVIIATSDTVVAIGWTNDEPTTGTIAYGETEALGQIHADETAGLRHVALLAGLQPGTWYLFTCRADDVSGNSGSSGMAEFMTSLAPDTTPPNFVIPPEVISVSDTTILITWETDKVTNAYVVVWDESDTVVYTCGDLEFAQSHFITVTNLYPDTTYYCQVGGSDLAGNAIVEPAVITVTSAWEPDVAPPQFVLGPESMDVGRTSARIRWSTDEYATGQIAYGANPSELFSLRATTEGGFERSVLLWALEETTTYYYVVQATDFVGNSADSEIGQFTTLGAEGEGEGEGEGVHAGLWAMLVGLCVALFGIGAGGGCGGPGGGGGPCFVATAAYGTQLAADIDTLRVFRDTFLLSSPLGTALVDAYYRVSPLLADMVAQSPFLAAIVRVLVVLVILAAKSPSTATLLLFSGGLRMMVQRLVKKSKG